MFKMLMNVGVILINVNNAFAIDVVKSISCSNENSSFQVLNYGNLRNKANAQLANVQGDFSYNGPWLWIKEHDKGFMGEKIVYHLNWGEKLIVSKTQKKQYCGRGDCSPDYNSMAIYAYYIDSNQEESFYECQEVNL